MGERGKSIFNSERLENFEERWREKKLKEQ
jgi:hypothetical protein